MWAGSNWIRTAKTILTTRCPYSLYMQSFNSRQIKVGTHSIEMN